MTNKQSITFIMVQAITILTALNMLTNAQTTCNQGLGRVVYERLPDHQLQGLDDDAVQDSTPPFRVLEKCQELCLRDRTAASNLVRTCTSFDFQPGSRITSSNGVVEYEQSTCYLTREQAQPEGIGTLVSVPNSVHYTEVCLSSSRIERECSDRHYVFERHPRKKLKLPITDMKELIVANRTDCEDRCLNEFTFVCRSATYDTTAHTCWISKFTRRSHPELMEDDPTSDYLENTCLNAERRCDGSIIFVKEENKRLGGPFEVDIFTNISLLECQAQCLRAEKYFCRAVEYDDRSKQCIIFEEDSMSQRDDLRVSGSPSHDLYDLVCLDSVKGNDFPENSALFSENRKPDTAFQRYRNSRLGGDFHSEINGRSLGECLDECLRQVSFQCHSIVYSERFRICRLSKYNQRDGHRVIYDGDYDYYENLVNSPTQPPPFQRPELGPDAALLGHSRLPYAPLAKPPTGAGFSNAFGGGTYPGYSGPPNQQSRPPYNPSREMPGHGYWNHLGTHSTDVSPYNVPLATSGAYAIGSITPIPPASYPGAGGSSPAYFGSSATLGGGSSLGYPHLQPGVASYPPPLAGGYYPGGFEPPRPFNTRCEEGDGFKQIGVHLRVRKQFVRKAVAAPSLSACERECAESRDFLCRSFNYRAVPYGPQRENCELTDRDTRDLDANNPNYFENAGEYDFYERAATGRSGQDCLDVSQTCSEDGMEFTLRTPEGFIGRIYTHGYYDRCFYRGNGGQVNVLRISGAQGYPDCGTIKAGDMLTNIVVVQFSDFVQTSRDKRYNLTCLFRTPGETVVTSNYMTANSGSPVPIEYLPAENTLSSRVRLSILYQNRPTNTIAVGDPLTFRIEAQDGYNRATDIFATNVTARDPYSGKSYLLIDRYGCPTAPDIFPALDRARDSDGLEARFNAFKLPESNFLIFEATVRTCREGCNPAYCQSSFGNERSLGRRKRETGPETEIEQTTDFPLEEAAADEKNLVRDFLKIYKTRSEVEEDELSRLNIANEAQTMQPVLQNVCLSEREYFGLLFIFFVFTGLVIVMSTVAGNYYRKYWKAMTKTNMDSKLSSISKPWSSAAARSHSSSVQSLFSFLSLYSQNPQATSANQTIDEIPPPQDLRVPDVTDIEECRETFKDSSEPIYVCPSLFEMPTTDEIS